MSSIRGLQKTTLIDYPGKIACTIFFSGCNFRCPFCHNKDLVLGSDNLPYFSEEKILNFLKSRIGILEGVVLTGGEPQLYQNLKNFIKEIKKMPFLVKLDTNGSNLQLLKELVKEKLIDYVAMDFKAPVEKYEKATGVKVNKKEILETMRFLISGKVAYEFRTTIVPGIHQEKDLIKMTKELKNLTSLGYTLPASTSPLRRIEASPLRRIEASPLRRIEASPLVGRGGHVTHYKLNWFLQQFRPGRCLNPRFNKLKPYPKSFYNKILPQLRKIIPNTFLRGV